MEGKRVRPSGAASAESADRASQGAGHDAGDDAANDAGDDFFAWRLEEKPIWTGLYESFRDALFPPRLPPLELTSTPIPAPDRMAAKTNPWAIGTATVANGGLLAILLLMGLSSTANHLPKSPIRGDIEIKNFPLFPGSGAPAGGSDGGGSNELIDPNAGRPPRQEIAPMAPPQIPLLENPRLAADPAVRIAVRLPDDPSLPNLGVQNSPNVTMLSNGPGTEAGIGTGSNGGDGPGKGPGSGPGSGPGVGDSIYTAGVGGVTNPIPLVSPEAEFSDEARRNKYQGICTIAVIVDARGFPQNPRVVRSLGMGLDEKALEAVERYRFKPALKDGKPVAVLIYVEVNFRLY
jgi:periplasmic protein TonB